MARKKPNETNPTGAPAAAAVWMPIDDLVPWGKNPRTRNDATIAALAAFTRALGAGSVHPRLLRSGVLDRGAIVFRGRGDGRPLPDAGTLTGRPVEDP